MIFHLSSFIHLEELFLHVAGKIHPGFLTTFENNSLQRLTKLTFKKESFEGSEGTLISSLHQLTALSVEGDICHPGALEPLQNLSKLQQLVLISTTCIDHDVCLSLSFLRGLTQLQYLDILAENPTFHGKTFVHFHSLKRLGLRGMSISNLDFCRNLSKLSSLYLRDCVSLKRIDELQNLTEINYFTMINCPAIDISPIARHTKLRDLHLEGIRESYISSINPQYLNHLQLMEKMILVDDSIQDIAFVSDMLLLKELNLRGNAIEEIHALRMIPNLKVLLLGGNNIGNIECLSNLTSLQEVDLGDNQVCDLKPMSKLTNLRSLGLEDNSIEDISPLSSLILLQKLNVSANSAQNIDSLNNLVGLESLVLAANDIVQINCSIGGLVSLLELDLSYNGLFDTTALSTITSLTHLDLSNNKIEQVGSLMNMKKLRYLSLAGNIIDKVACLSGLEELEKLRLENNGKLLLGPLLSLKKMKALSICECQIKDSGLRMELLQFQEYGYTSNNLEKLELGTQCFCIKSRDKIQRSKRRCIMPTY